MKTAREVLEKLTDEIANSDYAIEAKVITDDEYDKWRDKSVDQALHDLSEIVRREKVNISGMTSKDGVTWNEACDYIAKLFIDKEKTKKGEKDDEVLYYSNKGTGR